MLSGNLFDVLIRQKAKSTKEVGLFREDFAGKRRLQNNHPVILECFYRESSRHDRHASLCHPTATSALGYGIFILR
jgi:hypothetical protein